MRTAGEVSENNRSRVSPVRATSLSDFTKEDETDRQCQTPPFLDKINSMYQRSPRLFPKGIIFIEINDNDTTVLNLDAGSVRQKKRIEFGQSKRLSVTSKGHPGHRRVAMELSRGDGPQGSRLSHQQSVDQERIPQPDSEVSDEEHQVR